MAPPGPMPDATPLSSVKFLGPSSHHILHFFFGQSHHILHIQLKFQFYNLLLPQLESEALKKEMKPQVDGGFFL